MNQEFIIPKAVLQRTFKPEDEIMCFSHGITEKTSCNLNHFFRTSYIVHILQTFDAVFLENKRIFPKVYAPQMGLWICNFERFPGSFVCRYHSYFTTKPFVGRCKIWYTFGKNFAFKQDPSSTPFRRSDAPLDSMLFNGFLHKLSARELLSLGNNVNFVVSNGIKT